MFKASAGDCLIQLHATLARDWPVSFVQVPLRPLLPPAEGALSSKTLALCRAIDWGTAAAQVFQDAAGSIVVSFHRELAAKEGDITSYMNQHYRTDLTVQTFKLVKDTAQWGLLAAPEPAELSWGVFYVYWPPWVPRPKVIPPHLAGPKPAVDGPPAWPAGDSGREPFGARTDAGVLTKYDTRVHEHSMRDKGRSLLGRI